MSELSTMPEYEMKSFSRWLVKAVEKYFEDPDVQRRFEEWQKEEQRKNELKEKQECDN